LELTDKHNFVVAGARQVILTLFAKRKLPALQGVFYLTTAKDFNLHSEIDE